MSRLPCIVPVHNGLAMTVECLTKAIVNTNAPLHFILVDAASDESLDPLRGLTEPHGIPMDIIRHETPNVYKALNAGLRAAGDAEYAIILCSDVFPLAHWLPPCQALLREGIAWASPEEATGPYHWRTGWNVLQAGVQSQYDVVGEFKSSLALLHWKRLKEDVGFFEEDTYDLAFGDTSYLERMNDAGLKAAWVKGAFCQHLGSQSRRLTGVAVDVDREIRDAMAFVEKWKDRPEVLARHPGIEFYRPENAAHIRAQKARKWETE